MAQLEWKDLPEKHTTQSWGWMAATVTLTSMIVGFIIGQIINRY